MGKECTSEMNLLHNTGHQMLQGLHGYLTHSLNISMVGKETLIIVQESTQQQLMLRCLFLSKHMKDSK